MLVLIASPVVSDPTDIQPTYRNAVTTATLLRTSHFLSTSPHAMTLSRTIMTEVIAVATAKGLNIPDGTVDKLIEQCVSVKAEGGLGSSMMMDCLGGRGMEVEVGGSWMWVVWWMMKRRLSADDMRLDRRSS